MSTQTIQMVAIIDKVISLIAIVDGWDNGAISARKLDFSTGETENSMYLGVIF